MIQMQTVLEAADNSGAKNLRCIKVLGGSKKRYARVGDIIVASIKDSIPKCGQSRNRENQKRISQTGWYLHQI